ncbi:cell wall protein DAN4 [Myotis lucifugus]|uniref:cell wall protein DAN4 n=1 Tax=Myotis lucifugus TaxID=59463 RepID=UPI0006D722BB|nr:cell wall protein DAN4 [Myotis lucifugus]
MRLALPFIPWDKSVGQPSQKEPADSPVLISKSCYQDPPKMKGFYFLLFTISFLIMIQIQSGILQNISAPTTSTTSTTSSASTTSTSATTSTTRATTTTTFGTKKIKGGAPALSSLGSGGVLIFLANTLFQLLHLS